METQASASSAQNQISLSHENGRKEKRNPVFDSDRLSMMRQKVIAENKAVERVKRIVKYQPTKMIWKECVTYYRRSTDKQDTTIESQQTTCLRKAEEMGLTLVNEYSDEITGKADLSDRKGMSKMMKEIKPGQILIVYSISRIARQIEVFYNIMRMLKENGCRIICCHEKLDSIDPHMEVIWAVHAAFAQQEREAISSRTKAALATMKKNGQVVGRPRWGYKVDPQTKKLIPIPEFQEIIQSIVKMRRDDKLSLDQIAQILQELKISTPSGRGEWKRCMISKVLQQELGVQEAKKLRKPPRLSNKYKENEMDLLKEDLDYIAVHNTLDPPDTFEPETNHNLDDDTYEDEEMAEEEVVDEYPEEVAQPKQESLYDTKPLVVLRAIIMKRRQEFGLSEEEIRELSKEDIIELLQCV